jgi:regulator of nucleoside diphosphate kinase
MVQIIVTQYDLDRLNRLLAKSKPHSDFHKALIAELEKAQVVDSKEVPSDVITMNSQVHFSDDYGDVWDYWLVFPEQADLAEGKISVLSPIGCALLGYRIGDKFTVPTPAGRRVLKVEQIVHQPEREGHFDL